jgi:hypothetical protein
MHRGGQAPRPANDIKHGKMAVVGLAGGFWPISNTPLKTWGVTLYRQGCPPLSRLYPLPCVVATSTSMHVRT